MFHLLSKLGHLDLWTPFIIENMDLNDGRNPQKRKKRYTLLEEEVLAEEVKKYPCIYDRSCDGHKEKDQCAQAWKAIEQALGLEDGTYNFISEMSSGLYIIKQPWQFQIATSRAGFYQ